MIMHNNEIKIGQHCWAATRGELLIVLKTGKKFYQVCGAWECGITSSDLAIIEVIEKPKNYEHKRLYYQSDCDEHI